MRPSDITDGSYSVTYLLQCALFELLMRPSDITDGSYSDRAQVQAVQTVAGCNARGRVRPGEIGKQAHHPSRSLSRKFLYVKELAACEPSPACARHRSARSAAANRII